MKTSAKNYKAYIASSPESASFDHCFGQTAKSALSAIKRRNTPSWRDCSCWVVFVHEDGQEQKVE